MSKRAPVASGGGPRPRPQEPSRSALRRPAEGRRRRKRVWMWGGGGAAVVAAVVGIVLVTAHGGSPGSSSSTPRVELLSQGAAEVGQTAPAFTAATVSGSTFRAPGGKPTVVYFIAGWCSNCIPESQALARVEKERAGRVNILAVDADPTDPLSSLQNFIHQVGDPGYAFAQDDGGKLVQAFGATALDLTVVMDGSGHVVSRTATPIDDAAILAALAKAGVA